MDPRLLSNGVIVYRNNVIQVSATEWVALREFPHQPKAVVQRVIDTCGEDRYLLLARHAEVSQRRMVGIHKSLAYAEQAAPWPSNRNVTPPLAPHGR